MLNRPLAMNPSLALGPRANALEWISYVSTDAIRIATVVPSAGGSAKAAGWRQLAGFRKPEALWIKRTGADYFIVGFLSSLNNAHAIDDSGQFCGVLAADDGDG